MRIFILFAFTLLLSCKGQNSGGQLPNFDFSDRPLTYISYFMCSTTGESLYTPLEWSAPQSIDGISSVFYHEGQGILIVEPHVDSGLPLDTFRIKENLSHSDSTWLEAHRNVDDFEMIGSVFTSYRNPYEVFKVFYRNKETNELLKQSHLFRIGNVYMMSLITYDSINYLAGDSLFIDRLLGADYEFNNTHTYKLNMRDRGKGKLSGPFRATTRSSGATGRQRPRYASIFEFGDSIVSCETNFENLLKNWTADSLKIFEEYSDMEYVFIETLSDSGQYKYYRNYFSSDESLSGEKERSVTMVEGRKKREYFFVPRPLLASRYDTSHHWYRLRDEPPAAYVQKAKQLAAMDFDLDTVTNSYFTIERMQQHSDKFKELYINRFDGVGDQEYWAMQLDELMIRRIFLQDGFDHKVNMGDKVFSVKFNFRGALYKIYIVCSSETNKVVMDNFFQGVLFPLEENE